MSEANQELFDLMDRNGRAPRARTCFRFVAVTVALVTLIALFMSIGDVPVDTVAHPKVIEAPS